jgi:FK506-binding nuclear protein
MTSLLPLASYNLALEPFVPTQAIESDLPVTVHLTLAALDPNAIDDDEQPSTLRILKSSVFSNFSDEDSEDEDEFDGEAEEGEAESEEEESEEDEEEIENIKKGDADDEEGDDEEDDDDDDDVEEYVICTLSPKSQYQQSIDLTIAPDEEVFFVVTGSYPIHISGNYVEHPYDGSEDDYDSEDGSEGEDEYDSDEYDLTPDEDEILEEGDFDIDDLDSDEDVEGKIEELVEEEEKKETKPQPKKESKKAKKENKKREAEEPVEEVKPKETKKQKQAAKAAEEKNVQFNKELEQGPTKQEKKPVVKTLAGGVVIEDRTAGKGPTAKNGSRVGVRYIGKLKNGSVFDKNTSGKPFQFHLGKGEVIKGWDIGVQGMAVGGERRIVVPPAFAYGKKKLPGLPANSELTFDVKLVSLK